MKRSEILNSLTEIFRDVFDDDSIQLTDNIHSGDIDGWDSLTHITLISEIEETFGIKISMKDVLGMQNVGEMIQVIERAIL